MQNQKINCTVSSCRYNDTKTKACELSSITVGTTFDSDTQKDATLCQSYAD